MVPACCPAGASRTVRLPGVCVSARATSSTSTSRRCAAQQAARGKGRGKGPQAAAGVRCLEFCCMQVSMQCHCLTDTSLSPCAQRTQVDDLKRENQKLLQIIAQLQSASIGCISAPLAPATTTSTLGPDAEADGPAGTASCMSAGVAPDSIDSTGLGGSGLHGSSTAPAMQSCTRGLSCTMHGILVAGTAGSLAECVCFHCAQRCE